jgi:hypothetical protein
MTIARYGGCVITGLSGDTKPNHAGLNGYRFIETDTGRVWFHNGSSWAQILGRDKTETLTNKTISIDSNTISDVLLNPFATSYKRVGFVVPGTDPAQSTQGAIRGWPTAGTLSIVNDATEGYCANFNSSTNGFIFGYLSNSSLQLTGRREWNVVMKARVKASSTTSSRMYIGFSSLNTLTASDTILSTSDHGVLVGFSTATANFSAFHNDGSGSQVVDSMGTAKNTNFNTFEISMASGGNVTISLNGSVTNTLSADLPGDATNIFGNCVLQNATASSRDLIVKAIHFRSDK